MGDDADKTRWRARLLAARRTLDPPALAAAAAALRDHLVPALPSTGTIAAYVPVRSEPGSLDLLDELHGSGIRILLPVVSGTALDWCTYAGRPALVAGPFGLREPAGPRLGPSAVAGAGAVLVPALAVDHAGTRLGRGAGYYDRALADVPPGVPIVALLHDGELVPALPADAWDRPVTAAALPSAGYVPLPITGASG